jgi:hypothetical protein
VTRIIVKHQFQNAWRGARAQSAEGIKIAEKRAEIILNFLEPRMK